MFQFYPPSPPSTKTLAKEESQTLADTIPIRSQTSITAQATWNEILKSSAAEHSLASPIKVYPFWNVENDTDKAKIFRRAVLMAAAARLFKNANLKMMYSEQEKIIDNLSKLPNPTFPMNGPNISWSTARKYQTIIQLKNEWEDRLKLELEKMDSFAETLAVNSFHQNLKLEESMFEGTGIESVTDADSAKKCLELLAKKEPFLQPEQH